MNKLGFFLILSGITVIVFPDFIAYLIGAILVIIGISILGIQKNIKKTQKAKETHVKFGNYKIFR